MKGSKGPKGPPGGSVLFWSLIATSAATSYYLENFYGTVAGNASPSISNELELPSARTLKNLRITAAGGNVTKDVTFTVYRNGSATTITCTMANGTAVATDTTHSVAFSQGDRIAVLVTHSSGAPGTARFHATLEEGTSAVSSSTGIVGSQGARGDGVLIAFVCPRLTNTAAPAQAKNWIQPWGLTAFPDTVAAAAGSRIYPPYASTIKQLRASRVATAGDLTFEIEVNGTTRITLVLPGGSGAASIADNVSTYAVTQTDYISVALTAATPDTSTLVLPQITFVLDQ